ncbi:type VI secretion system contractile sheath large subunit [Chitiniphilus purpureus]|uniref:Type VI secretion system contractile sheath large subunit n=1 Tax=Chitiniphilus purpureus TaxID=2981137 RepID=A0ABY6DS95_9NEIS|nr:type VI secretion system contractile sheath large subunit [Chitiniphilus sp. CD1]UXY17239.1 type VI secretion system contractile sheath large subunit [Chitiniphilus sp. CD1]
MTTESIQKRLLRVRPPRVRITYDVETLGSQEKRELPFIVGIFADLSGDRNDQAPLPGMKERVMVEIDRDNFNDVLKSSLPRVTLPKFEGVADDDPGNDPTLANSNLAIVFESLDDFEPLRLVKRVPALAQRYEARTAIRTVQARSETDDKLAGLLDSLVDKGADGQALRAKLIASYPPDAGPEGWRTAAVTPSADKTAEIDARLLGRWVKAGAGDGDKAAANVLIGHFVAEVIKPLDETLQDPAKSKDLDLTRGATAQIDARVCQIDQALSAQLSNIMHSPSFRALEATWRGIFYLVSRAETGPMLKLRVFNATRGELLQDMDKAVEFDQSTIFKLIYEAEYGTFGGVPYSLLVGGYEFGGSAEDIRFLTRISEVAAAAHAPFLAAADAKLFGLPSYDMLAKPRDLAKIFEGADLGNWRDFRQLEDSRYVALVLPHVLLRLPYGPDSQPADGIDFREDVFVSGSGEAGTSQQDNRKFLWGNAAYALAERITNAFAVYNWTAAIRGVEGGGLVTGLPQYVYDTDAGTRELFCPTEVAITDRREKELNDLGFIALCHCKGSGKAAFFGGQTTNLPKKYVLDDANANSRISAMLPYILAASRFAHYIKVIMRDKIGTFLTRGNVEAYLNTWIAQYVLLDDNATQDVKATYPLREASVVVTDVAGEPGVYKATVFLKPHFQLEELTTSIRLVAKLPK